jgi:hypothetical protein
MKYKESIEVSTMKGVIIFIVCMIIGLLADNL